MATVTPLDLARKQVGIRERENNVVVYNDWYYGKMVSGAGVPWCVTFVQWCFEMAGEALPFRTASCSALLSWYRSERPWCVFDAPAVGDIVIYAGHCGIVEQVLDGHLVAIEGNTSDNFNADGGRVMRRERQLSEAAAFIRPSAPKPGSKPGSVPENGGAVEEKSEEETSMRRPYYYHPHGKSHVTVVVVPQEAMRKLELYTHDKNRLLDTFYELTGADLLFNTQFFDTKTKAPCFGQVVGGFVRSDDNTYRGLGTKAEGDTALVYGALGDGWWDFTAGYPVLVTEGRSCAPFAYATELSYAAARSALGVQPGGTLLYVHVGSPGMTLAALAELFIGLGAEYAINLDGGGSARCLLFGSDIGQITGIRAVDSVMGVWFRAPEEVNPWPVPDGIILRRGSKGNGVRWLQWELRRLELDTGGLDGDYGPKTEAAVKAVQESIGLAVDGIAGPLTIGALMDS